jgi:ABC-2 type transport system ATP-binding protein
LNDGVVLDAERFRGLPGVITSRRQGDAYCLTVAAPHVTLPALLQWLQNEHQPLSRLTTRQASLEDVFVSLTGRGLDDAVGTPSLGIPAS